MSDRRCTVPSMSSNNDYTIEYSEDEHEATLVSGPNCHLASPALRLFSEGYVNMVDQWYDTDLQKNIAIFRRVS